PDIAASLADKVVIVGGSGLLGRENLELGIKTLLAAKVRPRALILWGAGNNVHDETRLVQPEYLREFDLVGIRAWGDNEQRWNQCVSAMHRALKSPPEPQHEYVIFELKNVPLRDLGPFPRRSNRTDDVNAVMTHIASGETLLTNSYHGAYWGTLMGR